MGNAFMNSARFYVQVQIKVEEGELSHLPLQSNKRKEKKNKSYLAYMTLQVGETSLSANAPACVAVWGWEEPAGCVLRTAPPPASGIVPDLGG